MLPASKHFLVDFDFIYNSIVLKVTNTGNHIIPNKEEEQALPCVRTGLELILGKTSSSCHPR